jgi:REP element-mobilizing transposase RayT
MTEEEGGAQAPSPVINGRRCAAPHAKPACASYRRNVPHLQRPEKTFFITFCTHQRWRVPEHTRGVVLAHCLADNGVKIAVHGVVVMPDHVHMVLTPLRDEMGAFFGLAEIMNGIKGTAAHSVNRVLKRRGRVWQEEYFDRLLRSSESIRAKVEYICENPVRKGLVATPDEYPWLWREWIEGVASEDSDE